MQDYDPIASSFDADSAARVGTVAAMLIPAWFLYPWMVDILNAPYCDALRGIEPTASCKFLETNLLDPFTLRMRVAGYGGPTDDDHVRRSTPLGSLFASHLALRAGVPPEPAAVGAATTTA